MSVPRIHLTCRCTHEAGDSVCAEHPICNHCGESVEDIRDLAVGNVEEKIAQWLEKEVAAVQKWTFAAMTRHIAKLIREGAWRNP